jgi:hypothetical protein
MTMIFDGDGNELADIALSEKQQAVLDHDEDIIVIYHTPQMLRYILGEQSGTFMLHKRGDRIIAAAPDNLRAYAKLQRAIKIAREQH